jgi:steroid delta-isomerase-like uncharacterized protein
MGAVRLPVVLAAITACSADLVSRPSPPPVDWLTLEPKPLPDAALATKNERAIAELYLKAASNSDPGALGRVLADEVHFNIAGLETTAVYGRAGVATAHDQLFGSLSPRHFAPTRVLITDRSQSIEWTLTGHDEATGRAVGVRGVTRIGTKDDGTISDLRVYVDQGVLRAQISGEPAALAELAPATAPAEHPLIVEQSRSPDETAAAAAVGHWIDALQRDPAAYVGLATDDVEIATPQRAAHLKGKGDLRDDYDAMHRAIGGLDIRVDDLAAVGRFVVAEYHVVGTQLAKYLYVPVKEPVIKLYIVDVVEMRGGKIARVWRYDNPLQILQ